MPSFFIAQMSLLATRERNISPMIATFKFSILPLCSLIVKRSSSAWLGCSFSPSPAFTIDASQLAATNFAAPEQLWRSTKISVRIACIFLIVSINVSPFFVLLSAAVKFTLSAPRRLAAISKLVRVRVEFSKNALMTVLPRSESDFLTSERLSALNSRARSIKS